MFSNAQTSANGMAGRSIYPTDVERAAARVEGVRPGCVIAVRLDAGKSRESFAAVAAEREAREIAEISVAGETGHGSSRRR